eukprot:8789840-Alexandrium_andersonii.AAC.1
MWQIREEAILGASAEVRWRALSLIGQCLWRQRCPKRDAMGGRVSAAADPQFRFLCPGLCGE